MHIKTSYIASFSTLFYYLMIINSERIVSAQPNKPTLTGPTTVTAGSSNTWTCLSIGGNPEPEMSIRINDRVFSQEVTVNSVYDQSSKSFRTTGTLTWAPSSRFNLETLYCDVLHEETSDRVQTVNLPLTVICKSFNESQFKY